MTLKIEDAKSWVQENYDDLERNRLECPDETVQMINRMIPDKSREMWNAGCWMAEQLREHGANDEQVSSIQMAQGQRSFGGCPWQAAVDYANEFIENGDTEEKGGVELAIKRNNELFGAQG